MNPAQVNAEQGNSRLGRLICPLCSQAFAFGAEEYCPHDGERLQREITEPVIADAAPIEVDAERVTSGNVVDPVDSSLTPAQDLPAEVPGDQFHEPESMERPVGNGQEAPSPDAANHPNPAPGAKDEEVGMLGRLFEQFGIRRKSPRDGSASPNTQPEPGDGSEAAGDPASPDVDDNPLPEGLREAGWRLVDVPHSDEYADTWTVVKDGLQGRFTRYRGRVLTSPALYRQLRLNQHCTVLPTVLDAGTVNLRGHAQASYDLTALTASGGRLQRLDEWLRLAPPSEQKAAALLPALAELLESLHAAGVAPILLQPSHVLRNESGRLMLSHVAALTSTGTDAAAPDYRPELECNALISRLWGAPEISEQLVVHPAKAGTFSVGQILATAVWGQAMDLAALRAGQIPLHSLQDARLARVLQGCLWAHHIEGRWSRTELSQAVGSALDAMPAAEDWARLGPQAMGVAFALNGQTFWRVEDLVAAAVSPSHWSHAAAQLATILDWIEGSTWASAVAPLRAMLAQGRSADHVLIRLSRQVRPDLPLTWRALSLDDHCARQALVHLAQRTLAEDATAADRQLLRELFQADLRGAFSGV